MNTLGFFDKLRLLVLALRTELKRKSLIANCLLFLILGAKFA
jgi:hypothetical protein